MLIVITTVGLSGIALLVGSINTRPQWLAIGSGSGATSVTTTGLVAEVNRLAFTTIDLSIVKKISWTTSFSSTQLSGLTLREYGTFSNSAANSGTNWGRQGIQPVVFDGTVEADIEILWELS